LGRRLSAEATRQRHTPATITFYRWSLDHFLWWLEREHYSLTLAAITANHIRAFLIYLESAGCWDKDQPNTDKPLAPASIHAFARTLRAFFNWATKEARLDANPFANCRDADTPQPMAGRDVYGRRNCGTLCRL
jgi:site-specific recombinase XerD